jgi:hypothetical protein
VPASSGPQAIGIASDKRFVGSNSYVMFQRMVATVAVVVCATTASHAAAQADDFGFRLEDRLCLMERYDSVSGVFTKELASDGHEPARTVTAKIVLTDVQMREIYQAIENIRFFDYPSAFVGVPKGLEQVMEFSPSHTYRLEVRNRGAVHTVEWKDAARPTTPEADRLRNLIFMVQGFVHVHPEFKRLPPAVRACE